MIAFIKSDDKYFVEAIELAITNKQPFSWRAAWLLWSCMENNDKRIQDYLTKIIDSIASKRDGQQRDLLKILLKMELNEEQEAYLFDVCVTLWEKINKKPSVRITAFKFIIKIAKKHPDLFNEITFLTQNHYLDSLSNGVKKSVFKMISGISTHKKL